jgi:hypothetical protein
MYLNYGLYCGKTIYIREKREKEAANVCYLISLCHYFWWIFFAVWIINKQIGTLHWIDEHRHVCFFLDRKRREKAYN